MLNKLDVTVVAASDKEEKEFKSGVEEGEFYGVSIPKDSTCCDSEYPLVFTSKADALTAIKKYNGARFMKFTSYVEAVEYGSKPLPSSPSAASNAEEKATFRSLSSQEMVSLRKAIEVGNEVLFLDKVWSNPRYLINNAGDGPSILQEGTRYNALHIAAKFKKTNMCLTVLNTIHDARFISELYPNENSAKIKDRIKRLVDLYLNTPDKSLSETPLHFACKYGADEILSILLSFPECDINRRNKYGILAKEMICDRVPNSLHLKEKMLLNFEDLFYVPILRDVTNIQEPVIGKPCCSNIVLEATSLALTSNLSYGKDHLIYCAFAGPMSQSTAEKFYKTFSRKKFAEQLSFTPEQKQQLVDICLSDSKKGLERVGRKLANEFDVCWTEFWAELNFWGDLSSSAGLEFLETHLKNQYAKINASSSSLETETRCNNFHKNIAEFVDEFVIKLPYLLDNMSTMTFFVLFQGLVPYIFCMTDFSFSEDEHLFLIHSEIGQLLYLKLNECDKKSFDSLKYYINMQLIHIERFSCSGCKKWKMFLCILKYVCYYQSSNVLALKTPVCDCKWTVKKNDYSYNSSLCYYSIVKLRQNFINYLASRRNLFKDSEVCTLTLDKYTDSSKSRNFSLSSLPEKSKMLNSKKVAIDQEREQSFTASFYAYEDVSNQLNKYCAIGELIADKFYTAFSSLILNYSDIVPLNSEKKIFDAFSQIMPLFKPLCRLNFSQNPTLTFHHGEIAVALLNKIHISSNILNKCKIYFKSASIFTDVNFDVCKCQTVNIREWTYLFCVIKYLSALLNNHRCPPPLCTCQFELGCECKSIKAIYCSNCLKGLQNMCKISSDLQESISLPDAFKSLSLDTTEEEYEEYFTPPESPPCDKIEVYINGIDFSDIDIDVFRAIVDGRSKISEFKHPYIFSWKKQIESKLKSLLKPEDKLSCTPSSSSASLRRAVTPKKSVRRTLF